LKGVKKNITAKVFVPCIGTGLDKPEALLRQKSILGLGEHKKSGFGQKSIRAPGKGRVAIAGYINKVVANTVRRVSKGNDG